MILRVWNKSNSQDLSGNGKIASPLRNKLVLTLALALTPVLLLSGFKAYIDAKEARDNQRKTLVLVADSAIDGVDRALNQAELLLSVFEPQVAAGECTGTLEKLSVYSPSLANVVAYDANDDLICAAVGQPGVTGQHELIHDRLRAGGDSVIKSDAFFGNSSNVWLFTLNKRVVGPEGGFRGVNTFALEANKLAGLLHTEYLPIEVSLALSDEHGRVFGNSDLTKIPEEWIVEVKQDDAAQLFRMEREEGDNLDVVLKPVGNSRIFAVISRPSYGLLNDIFVRPAISFGLPFLAFAVTLLAAWMAIDGLVLRWISRLRRTVRIYGAGRYDFRPGNTFANAPDEIRSLATAMGVMAQDIEQRDTELKEVISMRDAAMREIHHRVKNNLQIVTSFLNLQGRQLKDEQAKSAISATRHRIDALAIVHQTLYQNERLQSVSMQPFLSGLLNHLADALGMEEAGIHLEQSYENIERDADDAIPIALFIVEAITNAIKYAFEGNGGEISVDLHTEGAQVVLEIRDSGIGFESGAGEVGLGSKLMAAFARQLSADFTTETRPSAGCIHKLVMPL